MAPSVHHNSRQEGRGRLGRWFTGALVLGLIAPAICLWTELDNRAADLLAQFVGPAFVIGALLSAGLLLVRRRAGAVAFAAASAVLALAAWPQWFPPTGRAPEDAPRVRLYSANLWARNEDVDAIAASLREAAADIVVLIEVGDIPSRELEVLLRDHPHRMMSPRLERPSGAARSLIASRFPLVTVPDPADGLHSVAARVDTPIGVLNVVGVHLTRPWPFQEQWGQASQVMALASLRRRFEGPVVVAGDFNSVSTARIGRQMKLETGLVPAPGFSGTWPAALPGPLAITIDHVWRSPDLALLERRLGRPNGSDHRPVVTTLARNTR